MSATKYGKYSLFQEETSGCAVIHTCYIMDVCDRVRSILLLPPMMGMSFVLVVLTRLIVSEPKHWVTWSHRGKESNTLRFLLNHIIFNSFFTYGVNYIWKIRNFCLLLKHFLRKLNDFCLIKSVFWLEILLGFDG